MVNCIPKRIKRPYGWVFVDNRYSMLLVYLITVLICLALYFPYPDYDWSDAQRNNPPVVEVGTGNPSVDITVSATPDYDPT
jgi:hypothetical protein